MPRLQVSDRVPAEIAGNTGRFLAAVISSDGGRAAAVYSEDAFLLSPTGDVISGRDAIERFWRGGIEIGLRSVKLEPLGYGGVGSILYEHGRYRMLLRPANGRPRAERGAYVIVHLRTDDGSWRWAVSSFGTVDARHQNIGNE